MIVCDYCEGRDKVSQIKIKIGVAKEEQALVETTADLCPRCRANLLRVIEDAIHAPPKETIDNASVTK